MTPHPNYPDPNFPEPHGKWGPAEFLHFKWPRDTWWGQWAELLNALVIAFGFAGLLYLIAAVLFGPHGPY